MTFERIFPAKLYESQAEVTPILAAIVNSGLGANTNVVTGIAGKRIRVMGWIAHSINATGQGTFQFKTASGGAALTSVNFATLSTSPPNQIPVIDSGYFEANTGDALVADIVTNNIYLTVFYIVYTP